MSNTKLREFRVKRSYFSLTFLKFTKLVTAWAEPLGVEAELMGHELVFCEANALGVEPAVFLLAFSAVAHNAVAREDCPIADASHNDF